MEAEFVLEQSDQVRWAWDRRMVVMATRLLNELGIPAEPGFDVSSPRGNDGERYRSAPFGLPVFKDVFAFSSNVTESPDCRVLVVDEKGLVAAESRQSYTLGAALELLHKLPLPLSARAERWVKDCLSEGAAAPAPGTAPPAPGAATQPIAALVTE